MIEFLWVFVAGFVTGLLASAIITFIIIRVVMNNRPSEPGGSSTRPFSLEAIKMMIDNILIVVFDP